MEATVLAEGRGGFGKVKWYGRDQLTSQISLSRGLVKGEGHRL